MKKLGCFFGSHNFELVAVNRDYHTTYTDSDRVIYHTMRFYQCSCGERKFKTDYANKYSTHNGINLAKDNWLDVGVVPSGSYDPRTVGENYVPTPPTPTKKPIINKSAKILDFKVIKGGNNE
jgi:hypothetical protein